MAIAFDSATIGGFTTTSPLTFSHTVSGSNTILIIGCTRGTTGTTITGVTYNGIAMSFLAEATASGVSAIRLYSLISPSTGANSVSIAFTGGGNTTGVSSSYTGVKQTSFPDSSNTVSNNAMNLSLSTTVVGSNCWLVSTGGTAGAAWSAGTGSTARANDTSDAVVIGDSNGTISTGSQSMTWNTTSTSDCGVIVSLAPFVVSTTNANFFLLI